MSTLALGSTVIRPLPLNWRRISALAGSIGGHVVLIMLLLLPPVAMELQRRSTAREKEITWVEPTKPEVAVVEPPLPVPKRHEVKKLALPTQNKPVVTMDKPVAVDSAPPVTSDAGTQPAAPASNGLAADIGGGESAPTALSYGTQSRIGYPRVAMLNREQGTVMLRVLVGADGKVERIEIDKSSGSTSLDRAAREAVMRWIFKPGTRDGVAYAAWARVPINFTLPK